MTDIHCKGTAILGSACGKCPRCYAEAERSFDTLLGWIQGGTVLLSPTGNKLRRWQRGDWRAEVIETSPAGPFKCIDGPNFIVYLRPAEPPGIGYRKRIDPRGHTTLQSLAQVVVSISSTSDDAPKRDTLIIRPDVDEGAAISRIARSLTPEQVAELHAVALANMYPKQTPTGPWHWQDGGIYPPLRDHSLLVGEAIRGWGEKEWLRARLTDRGMRVLLHIAEQAMVSTGRMEPYMTDDEGGDAP